MLMGFRWRLYILLGGVCSVLRTLPTMMLRVLPIAVLVAVADAVTISLNAVNKTGAYLSGLPDAERARIASYFKTKSPGSSGTTVSATQLAYVQYTLSVGVGEPATYYNIVLDTGSSNTFVG